jgi:hypothetical protein
MKAYIKGLSYDNANKAIELIRSFVKNKLEDRTLDLDQRLAWKEVSASLSVQSVAVYGAIQDQIDLLNVLLSDNDCGFIDTELPFLYKSKEEKAEVIQNATIQVLTEGSVLPERTN